MFPIFQFWSNILTGAVTGNFSTKGMHRQKLQETMRRHPEWFDEKGNFIGWPVDDLGRRIR